MYSLCRYMYSLYSLHVFSTCILYMYSLHVYMYTCMYTCIHVYMYSLWCCSYQQYTCILCAGKHLKHSTKFLSSTFCPWQLWCSITERLPRQAPHLPQCSYGVAQASFWSPNPARAQNHKCEPGSSPIFHFETRSRPDSLIYRVSRDSTTAG